MEDTGFTTESITSLDAFYALDRKLVRHGRRLFWTHDLFRHLGYPLVITSFPIVKHRCMYLTRLHLSDGHKLLSWAHADTLNELLRCPLVLKADVLEVDLYCPIVCLVQ